VKELKTKKEKNIGSHINFERKNYKALEVNKAE